MGVRIIADSTADMPKHMRERLITVPLMVHFDEKEFIDGVTITREEFYDRLATSSVSPSTSQPSPHAFREKYEEVLAAGDHAVVITISSKLSGTYQSAVIAAEGLEDCVRVIDSQSVTIGHGILCELALRLVDEGKSASEITAILEKERDNIVVVALLDTLEYLLRGGRISKTSAFVGKLLSVKPVLTARDGEIVPLGKARGIHSANNFLVTEIERVGGIDFQKPLMIGYSGKDDAMVKKYVNHTRTIWKGYLDHPESVCMGSVIGTHAGPGAVGVAFFKQMLSNQ